MRERRLGKRAGRLGERVGRPELGPRVEAPRARGLSTLTRSGTPGPKGFRVRPSHPRALVPLGLPGSRGRSVSFRVRHPGQCARGQSPLRQPAQGGPRARVPGANLALCLLGARGGRRCLTRTEAAGEPHRRAREPVGAERALPSQCCRQRAGCFCSRGLVLLLENELVLLTTHAKNNTQNLQHAGCAGVKARPRALCRLSVGLRPSRRNAAEAAAAGLGSARTPGL